MPFDGFAARAQDAPPPVDFGREIRSLLTDRCVSCHGPKKQEGGLRLDLRQRALSGGDSGANIVPKESAKSDLYQRLISDDRKHRMPPSGARLTAAELARVKSWIDQGAHWPDELAGKEGNVDHWAFRPVRRSEPPTVQNTGWGRGPIDRFILARLEKESVAPAAEADERTLVRRLYLDLVGLPPTPDQVEDYLRAASRNAAAAFEELVDRLLASPHYGERWGRHWLDLVRFAESDGYENDKLRLNAWRYRDWVVNALNQDIPFDRFTIEQLAGDLLPSSGADGADAPVDLARKIAAGMHRNTLHNSASSADPEEFRTYAVKDQVDTTGAVWLGLTLGCAKCHSHKYDPVSQREYYQLYAFFNNTKNHDVPIPNGAKNDWAMTLKTVARPTHVHVRGEFLKKGETVSPGVPAFLPPMKARGQSADRLDLARWLVEPGQPLAARVAVNRLWAHLFGRGLVATPDNFGATGMPPSHPELLDWLASEFIRLGWSQKQLIKTIVLSSAYRQSSRHRPELVASDPDNRLVARQGRFRVEGEIIRDLALAASGLLDPALGGPSIVPPRAKGLPGSGEELKPETTAYRRRSIYVHVQRTQVHPVLATFDPADPNQSCASRGRSCTPMQALTLLNDPTFVECARALGQRLMSAHEDRAARLSHGFQLCLGRPPSAAELAILVELVEKQRQRAAAEEAVWSGVARTLLNLEQFTMRE